MRCSGRDDELVAFVCTNGLAADAEVERSVDDVEALGLGGMDVGGCDDAVRLDDRLDADDLATGLGCGLVEDQHFACYRVLEPFSWTDHGSPFGAGCDARQRAWHRARRRRPAAGSFVRPRWDLLLIPRRDSERARREDSTSVDDRVDRDRDLPAARASVSFAAATGEGGRPECAQRRRRLGALPLVWQKGYGSHALARSVPWLPLIVFAFLFGLSMDYSTSSSPACARRTTAPAPPTRPWSKASAAPAAW